MPDIFRTTSGSDVAIGRRLGGGGEGAVFEVNADTVAKIYKAPVDRSTPRGLSTERKLAAMVANAPPTKDSDGNVALAWPLELLYYRVGPAAGMMAGFTMPRIDVAQYAQILNYWNPQRIRQNPNIPNQGERLEELLQVIVRNILTIVNGIHKRGYIIGDINESNTVVHQSGRVAFLDSDSFQVRDLNGRVHRCGVGKRDYLDPRVIGLMRRRCADPNCLSGRVAGHRQSFACFDRCVDDDNFALAVVLFKLLMKGTHPFDGPDGEMMDKIAARQFPYNNPRLMTPARTRARWQELSDEWQRYFVDTFTTGKRYSAEQLLTFGHPLRRMENLGHQVTVSWNTPGTSAATNPSPPTSAPGSQAAGTAAGAPQIKCPKCGRSNASPGIFCRYDGCNAWLANKGRNCGACQVEIPVNSIYCERCGKEQHPGVDRRRVLRMR